MANAVHGAEEISGFYIKGGLGKTFARRFKERGNNEGITYVAGAVKNYVLYSAAIGYRFNQYLSTELNGQYRQFRYYGELGGVKYTQKIHNYFTFLNGYCYMPNTTLFTPYITLGAGYTYNSPSNLYVRNQSYPTHDVDIGEDSARSFAYIFGVGVKTKLNNKWDIDLSYRYVNLGKVKVHSTMTESAILLDKASQNLKGHQVSIGIIYYI
jgi:opacity protein-like surface antigen